jgi:hypothetical protein
MAVLRLYITSFQFNPKFSIEGVCLAIPSTVTHIFLFHLLRNIIHSIPFLCHYQREVMVLTCYRFAISVCNYDVA